MIKKSILSLLLSSYLGAQEWPFVCEDNDLQGIIPVDAMYIADSDWASIYLIPKTVKIDRKAKTLKFWITLLQTPKGQKDYATHVDNRYAKLGVIKVLQTYNYEDERSRLELMAHYTCNGSFIDKVAEASGWNEIIPGSLDEYTLSVLKKKYGLN